MTDFVQLVVLGLLAGGVYVAVGIGFGLVWGVLNIVNLAHGALVIIGGYITWQLFSAFHIDPFLSLPVDAVALFVLGYALQRGVINRIIRAPLLFTFLLTFGSARVLKQVTVTRAQARSANRNVLRKRKVSKSPSSSFHRAMPWPCDVAASQRL